MEQSTPEGGAQIANWQPLTPRQRRVLGTLIEKSKTTADSYPLTFLALTAGCNQKSNRAPINNYHQDQIEETVDYLKGIGAATLVLGNGRVPKVRHLAYQWMGISKVEAAIMTELLLRGEQTLGELRTRASRMEPIAVLAELQRLLQGLQERHLILYLTPSGRGQVVSHNLYPADEKAALQAKYHGQASQAWEDTDSASRASEARPSEAQAGDDVQPPLSLGRQPSASFRSPAPAPETDGPATAAPGATISAASGSGTTMEAIEELRRVVAGLQARIRFLEDLLEVPPPRDQSASPGAAPSDP
jgi:uncharacterized protein YceH (UPF0502 family)